MTCGVSASDSPLIACGMKQWPEEQCSSAYLLFVYGTVPDRNSIASDIQERALQATEALLQHSLDQLAKSDGKNDHTFAAASINDAIQKANEKAYQAAILLGQGICIGGVIAFCIERIYIVIPFGGGEAYLWTLQKSLSRIGDPVIYKHISSNAIGCYQIWNGKYWNGILPQNAKLLLCSDLLPNTPDIKEALKQSTANDSHKDTAALLLRQILEKAEQLPCAVIDIY